MNKSNSVIRFFASAFLLAASVMVFNACSDDDNPAPVLTVSTLAGDGTTTKFSTPSGVAADASGNVFVADTDNHRILKITANGVVSTFTGSGTAGFADGTGTAAQFNSPYGIAIDGNGNLFVGDAENHRVRKITSAGVVTTLAGNGPGYAEGTGTEASFFRPRGVAVDGSGNVYVADLENSRIRKITSAGVVSTLAGSAAKGTVNGTGTAAQFDYPMGIAVDALGNVFVADYNNNRVRKITSAGVVSTLAGSTNGFVDGNGVAAQFSNPIGVAVDNSNNVYIVDIGNHRIRKITSSGEVSTLAGNGTPGYVDGNGTVTEFKFPYGVTVNASGNIFYIADSYNNRIRKITIQ